MLEPASCRDCNCLWFNVWTESSHVAFMWGPAGSAPQGAGCTDLVPDSGPAQTGGYPSDEDSIALGHQPEFVMTNAMHRPPRQQCETH